MQLFFMVFGLMLVFEGILPFLAPDMWRRMVTSVLLQNKKGVRLFGLMSMLIGLGILYLLR